MTTQKFTCIHPPKPHAIPFTKPLNRVIWISHSRFPTHDPSKIIHPSSLCSKHTVSRHRQLSRVGCASILSLASRWFETHLRQKCQPLFLPRPSVPPSNLPQIPPLSHSLKNSQALTQHSSNVSPKYQPPTMHTHKHTQTQTTSRTPNQDHPPTQIPSHQPLTHTSTPTRTHQPKAQPNQD